MATAIGKITQGGLSQKDKYDAMNAAITNLNATLTKLDADTGVTGTTYNATYAVTTMAAKGLAALGMRQGLEVEVLDQYITNFNTALAALDADGGVTDTTYASLWALTDVVNNFPTGNIQPMGVNQGNIVKLLNDMVVKLNGTLAKLDADGGVADTNYTTLYAITDSIDESGCGNL